MASAGSRAMATAMIVLTVACGIMYCRVFKLRHSFDIAARSPTLLSMTGLYNLVMVNVVLLHLILLLEEEGLPCYAVFWPSYGWLALSCTPYCLRAFRLVVVYNTKYRLKFARFVKSKALAKSWALSAAGIFAYAAAIFASMQDRYARGNYGCFFFHERLVLEIGIGCCIVPASFLMFKLSAVNDVYGIKPEIMSVLGVGLAAGVLQFTLLELVAADVLSTSFSVHVASGAIVLLPNVMGLYWSTLFPLSFHRSFDKRRVVPSTATRRGCHSSLSSSNHRSRRASVKGGPTCLRYARERGDLAVLFGDFCRRCLCEESWEFIVEAIAYEDVSQIYEQHAAFIGIVDKYLRPTSPQEVNVSSAMRMPMTNFETTEQFSKLDELQRGHILDPPVLEIARMLDQNLLTKFRETPEMQRWLEQERHQAELKEAAKHLEGDGHMLALLESVPLGSQ